MSERAHVFGSHNGLVGIITEPPPGVAHVDAPAVVFANVGLNHRVGPNRIFVDLARQLAAAGYVSLRFDLSGRGDSEPRRTTDSDLARATLDMREAMDFLTKKKGCRRFVLLGFCSGVDSAHATSLTDDRVVGAIFIDGYAYPNLGFWLRYLSVRNLQPARWRRYFRRRLERRVPSNGRRETGEVAEVFKREYPSEDRFGADLDTLAARGVRMLFVFTGVADNHYNYRNQLHDRFGHRDLVEAEYYVKADHVFSWEADRTMVLDRLVRWMNDGYAAESPAAAPADEIRPPSRVSA